MGVQNDTELKILKFVSENSGFESRLAEKAESDEEFLQWGVPSELSVSEKVLIKCLHQLENQGYLRCDEKVHSHDPSEYIVSWDVTPKGKAIL